MFENKEVVIFGCKSTTKVLINQISSFLKVKALISVSSGIAERNAIADYSDLSNFCVEKGIDFYLVNKYTLKTDEDYELVKKLEPYIGFAMGWQRLIPSSILGLFKIGVFGMHGSSLDLPRGRGRSPMNWSILEGRRAFYTNLFKYDPGVDSGDIVDSFKFQISERDSAETMHFKNTLAMGFLIRKNAQVLLSGNLHLKKQSNDYAPTYYPKRTPGDSLINWEMDVFELDRFVRAVAPPFNGAFSYLNNEKVIISKGQVFDINDFGFEDFRVGSIVAIFPNGKFLIRCFGGLYLVNEYVSDVTINLNDFFTSAIDEVSAFAFNSLGNYDVEEH